MFGGKGANLLAEQALPFGPFYLAQAQIEGVAFLQLYLLRIAPGLRHREVHHALVEPVREVGGGIQVAMVGDPFGNAIGLIENPHFKVGETT